MKQVNVLSTVILAAILFLGASCSSSRNTASQSNMGTEQDSFQSQVAAFKQEWNVKLDSLDANISRAKSDLKSASGDEKTKMQENLDDLKAKQKELKQEIKGAGNKTADQWDGFKQDVSDKYDSLSQKVKDFFSND